MCRSARAAATKHNGLADLNNRVLFSPSSGGQKSRVKVSEELVSPEASLLGLQMATFLLCPHTAFHLCAGISGVLCVSKFPSLTRPSVRLDQGPEEPHFNLMTSLKTSIFRYSHILGCWGLGLQHMNFGVTMQPLTPKRNIILP